MFGKPWVTVVLVLGLLLLVACGPAATPTPTKSSTKPTSTLPIVGTFPTVGAANTPSVVAPTATATTAPGVTAAPTATATKAPVPTATATPKSGGNINVNGGTTATTVFDPLHNISQYGFTGNGTIANLWGQLVRVSPDDRLTLQPDMAESWAVSADGLSWVLKLRKGIVDHEGKPFRAEDAQWSIIRSLDRPNGVDAQYSGCLRTYLKPEWDAAKQEFIKGGGAEITGDMELTLRLKRPAAAFTACFTNSFQTVQPTTYTKPIDTAPGGKFRDLDPNKGEVIGYGPFKMDVKQLVVGSKWVWVKNPNYFRSGRPYLDSVTSLVIADNATAIANFRAGRLDNLGVGLASGFTRKDLNALKADSNAEWTVVLATGSQHINVNTTKAPFGPIGDATAQKLRSALNLALDRGELNDLAYDSIGHPSLPYSPVFTWIYTMPEWYKNLPAFDPDPKVKAVQIEAAKKLMTDAGYGPKNLLKTSIIGGTSSRAVLDVIAQEAKAIYMDIEVVPVQNTIDRMQKLDYSLGFDSKGLTYPDPEGYNDIIYEPWQNSGFNHTGYQNPKWLELRTTEQTQATEATRAPYLRQMAQIMYEDANFIGILRPASTWLWRNNWRGWVPALYHAQGASLENVWLAS